MNNELFIKLIKTSTKVSYAPPVCKRAQVQELRESQLKIDKNQGLVSYEDVWTSPVM